MKGLKNSIAWLPLIIAVSVVGGIWIGIYYNRSVQPSTGEKKFMEVLDLVRGDYVDEVDVDSIVEMTLPNLMANLDPHSVYIPAQDLQSVNEELEGSFSGVGISFTMLTDTVTVNEVIPGGPSEKAGLLPGDRILYVNDSLVAGKKIPQTDIVKLLRGEKGSEVKLGVRRQNTKKLLTFNVTRGDIPVNTVDAAYMLSPETGYIKVTKFGNKTADEFITALNNLSQNGAKSFVIDLRGNGGGFMEMAIRMANEFLPGRSPIVYTQGRHPREDYQVFSDGTGSFIDSDVVVLLDEFSASASEIFAGALQDNDRGLIIGRRSFGKGLVQRQTMLPDSSAVRLTVSRYYTPSGRCIQKDYKLGDRASYDNEILTRYDHGEFFNSDSIKFDEDMLFYTIAGRPVYGGGGIMPDVFVPNDTSGMSSYYVNVLNAGLLQKFAFEYSDTHRSQLSKAKSLNELLEMLPDNEELLNIFVNYASRNGVAARWYYINLSHKLIVNFLKALIASDILGRTYYYEVANTADVTVQRALQEILDGNATAPVKVSRGNKAEEKAEQ